MIRNFVPRGCVVASLISIAAASQALVAFDNFGPGDAYNTGFGWTVAGSLAGPSQQRVACQFTSAVDGMLDKIILPAQYVTGTNQWYVQFWSDGGDVLDQWVFASESSGLPDFGSGAPPLVITNPFSDPNLYPWLVLHTGTKYWVSLAPVETPQGGTGADSWLTWNLNSIGDTGRVAFSYDTGQTWDYSLVDGARGALRVEVLSPNVPGPAALLPFLLGAVVAWRRRR